MRPLYCYMLRGWIPSSSTWSRVMIGLLLPGGAKRGAKAPGQSAFEDEEPDHFRIILRLIFV